MKNLIDYKEKYLNDCENEFRLNDKTIKAYKIDLNQFFNNVNSYDKQAIENYIKMLNRKYDKPRTVKRKIASIKAFFSYLEFNEYIENNPFRKIRTYNLEPKQLPRTISLDKLKLIFNELYKRKKEANTKTQKFVCTRNVAIIELMFSTGLRISECCSIKKEDIELTEGNLRINGKGNKERILQIGNESVIRALNDYNKLNKFKSEYYFINKNGSKLSEQSVRNQITQITEQLNITQHITPHMFRHTFATLLLEEDVDIRYIQRILGHSSISTTQIYTHVSSQKQKEILTNRNPRKLFSLD